MKKQKNLLAFVHIEKAAGMTLTSILEENFTYRHCRVIPLKKKFPVVFDAGDMRLLQKINPFVEAISGHPVRPFSDLNSVRKVHYITLLRDPVSRYLSHYQFWVEKMNNPIKFEDFLEKELVQNFQTKKIAGCDDIEAAKRNLDKFLLVGVVEDFEGFLQVLQRKMDPIPFSIGYEKKNIGTNKTVNRVLDDMSIYKDHIIENNRLDHELYNYAKELFEKEKERTPVIGNKERYNKQKRKYLWKIFRNFYYVPLLKLISRYNARKESS